MVLRLNRGETCIRTICNIHKITQDDHGMLVVVNKVDSELIANTFIYNKDYNRFEMTEKGERG